MLTSNVWKTVLAPDIMTRRSILCEGEPLRTEDGRDVLA